MVPRLPGSCTPSRARFRQLKSMLAEAKSLFSLWSKTASTCCGCCRKLTFLSSSSLTVTTSVLGSMLLSLSHSSVATISDAGCSTKRSFTTLCPSATNLPSLLRFFFSSSDLIYFILFLLIIVVFLSPEFFGVSSFYLCSLGRMVIFSKANLSPLSP